MGRELLRACLRHILAALLLVGTVATLVYVLAVAIAAHNEEVGP